MWALARQLVSLILMHCAGFHDERGRHPAPARVRARRLVLPALVFMTSRRGALRLLGRLKPPWTIRHA
eukprot:365283-Chlamydomonas_euryale.AAC.4